MTNKTFCILPWIHAQTKPDGQIKPCCRFDHKNPEYSMGGKNWKFDKFNINTGSTYGDALASSEWEELRQKMLKGEPVAGCWKCYKEEADQETNIHKQGDRNHSMRTKENWTWNQRNEAEPIEENLDFKIRYLELSMGNYCNLKCRTCDGGLSTTWASDEISMAKFYPERSKPSSVDSELHLARGDILTIKERWDIADFSYVEEMKFTGGEPMLHPNFIKIMDMVISTGRAHLITLDIFTNSSWLPKDKVLDRLKQFKKVVINLSIDGVGKVNDYIRNPSKWTDVEGAVRQWLEAKQAQPETFEIKWHPCMSLYNVWQFPEMVDWWFNLNKEYFGTEWFDGQSRRTMIVNIVHYPSHLKLSLYPNKDELTARILESKQRYISKLEQSNLSEVDKRINFKHLDGLYNKVIGPLNSPLNLDDLQYFIEFTADLDKLRDEDLRTDIPEIWNIINTLVEYHGRL